MKRSDATRAGGQLQLDALIRVSHKDERAGEELRSPAQQRESRERRAASNAAEIIAWHDAIEVPYP